MGKFVNREEELAQIDEAIEILQGDQQPLRTPIIEFCGIDGIGKTTLLQQVEEKCRTKQVLYERKNIGEITAQHLSVSVQKLLAKSKPVIMILDSFDAVSGKEAGDLEIELRNLIFSNEKICIVLASKRVHHLGKTRSIARKMKINLLKPLNRESCFSYLDIVGQGIAPDIRELIYDWTQGYPLAMDIMIEAMLENQMDLYAPKDQKKLIKIITDKVINQTLLVSLQSNPTRLLSFQKLLSVLSFPRSFNLFIMKNLITEYVPEYALKSSIAYITLPEEINRVVNVVSWDANRSGYYIDTSVRHLFLLKTRIENPEFYIAVNKFLMKMDKEFVISVPEPDNIHYLCEYLYHFAQIEAIGRNSEVLLDDLEKMVKKDSADQILCFYIEFWEDEDLRNALGDDEKKVMTFIRKSFIELYKKLPDGVERFRYLLSFLSRTPSGVLPDTASSALTTENHFLILEPAIRQIMEEENSEVYAKFYDALSEDHTLQEVLGQDFERVMLLFADSSLGEDR